MTNTIYLPDRQSLESTNQIHYTEKLKEMV